MLGEIFVESYYPFGPALAAVIRPSQTLRARCTKLGSLGQAAGGELRRAAAHLARRGARAGVSSLPDEGVRGSRSIQAFSKIP